MVLSTLQGRVWLKRDQVHAFKTDKTQETLDCRSNSIPRPTHSMWGGEPPLYTVCSPAVTMTPFGWCLCT